jgi:ATP-dependent RNA helicase DHX36
LTIFPSKRKGAQRRLSVYKTKKKQFKDEDPVNRLRFSEGSANALRELFINYPPGDEDLSEGTIRKPSKKSGKAQGNQDPTFSRPNFTKADIEKKVELLETRIKESEQLQKVNYLFSASIRQILRKSFSSASSVDKDFVFFSLMLEIVR